MPQNVCQWHGVPWYPTGEGCSPYHCDLLGKTGGAKSARCLRSSRPHRRSVNLTNWKPLSAQKNLHLAVDSSRPFQGRDSRPCVGRSSVERHSNPYGLLWGHGDATFTSLMVGVFTQASSRPETRL